MSSPLLTPRIDRDPIVSITAYFGGEEFKLGGAEVEMLEGFQGLVREKDPDMLVCPECDDFSFPYLLARSRIAGVNIQLGRDVTDAMRFGRTAPY